MEETLKNSFKAGYEISKKIKKQVGKTWEPYRVFLRPIRNKLQQTKREIEDALLEKRAPKKQLLVNSINEILDPLNEVYNSLCSVKCDIIANGLVLDIIRLSHTFGLNLAKLVESNSKGARVKIIEKNNEYDADIIGAALIRIFWKWYK